MVVGSKEALTNSVFGRGFNLGITGDLGHNLIHRDIASHPDVQDDIYKFLSLPVICGSPSTPLSDSASFLADITLPDGTIVAPGQTLTKTWRVKNTGGTTWGSGYQLAFRDGDRLGAPDTVNVSGVAPGKEADLSVPLQILSSLAPGIYSAHWQLRNAQGTYFGPSLWFNLRVPNIQPSTGNAVNVNLVSLTSPANVSPGQRFQPEITVNVTGGELRQDRGDMLKHYSGDNYSGFPHIAVVGRAATGQPYTFRFSTDYPMVAPNASGTYESRWRVWANGGWVGPEIAIRFGVYQSGASRPPNQPSLVSPGDWAVYMSGQTPSLCARDNGDPDGDQISAYYFDIYQSGQLWNSGWSSSNCVNAAGLGDFGYQWRVKVRDSQGVESDWSPTWHFNIYSTNFTLSNFSFSPSSPSNSRTVSVQATIQGNAGHAWRRLSVNTANDGSGSGEWRQLAGWLDSPTLVANWETFHDAEGPHRLRLEIKRSESDPNVVVEERVYTVTRGVPSQPVQLAPPSNFWSNERSITFRWQPALRATSYRLVAGTSADPIQAPVLDVTLSGTTEYTATFTQDYARLNWKVFARNEVGETDSGGSGVWLGIDQVPPISAVSVQRTASTVYENQFAVSWDGSDNASGVHTYDVQVRSLPDGQWTDWLTGYPYAAENFTGQPGRTYEFRTRAHDIAGNLEEYPTTADASVLVDPAHRPPMAWWNTSYRVKRTVTVVNRMASGVLPANYPVQLHFDSSTTPTAAEIYDSSLAVGLGNDVRVVYNDQTELPRQISSFTRTGIDIWFTAAADIPAAGSSTSYTLYYGNSQASAPSYSAANVFSPQGDPNTRLLLYLNEGTGTTAIDASGNGNHGSLVGNFSQPWPAGRLASGLFFDGASRVRIADNASLHFGNQITVQAWVRPTVIDNAARNIVSKISSTQGSAFRLFLRQGYPMFSVDMNTYGCGAIGNFVLTANRWYHLAGVYDGTIVRIFVDGVEAGHCTPNGPPPLTQATGPLVIGSSTYENELFIGDIDQVKIAATAQTSFPYAQVSVDPSAAAGAEKSPQVIGPTDLVLQNLEAVPNSTGDVLVQATLTNQGTFPTYNEFFVHLYGNHTPTGPGDLTNSVGFWVNTPIAAGATVTLTNVISQTAFGRLATLQAAASEQTFTLTGQIDSLGMVNDSNRSNNIAAGAPICLASADAYESDNTVAQARLVKVGQTEPHTFHKADDQDWVSFTAVAKQIYRIQTTDLGSTSDTILALYDRDGTTLLATNDDYNNTLASQIEWTAPVSGNYFVQVRHWNPNAGGCGTTYNFNIATVFIHAVDPTPPYCVLRTAATATERELVLHGQGLNSLGALLQFRNTTTGATSIHFGLEVKWEGTNRITVDMAKIAKILWTDPKLSLVARITDGYNNFQPLSDWSAPFVLADDAATCGVSRPTRTAFIETVTPPFPSCVLRDATNGSERQLELDGRGFTTPGVSVQFLNTATNEPSISFAGEINWESDNRITVDLTKIKGKLWTTPKLALVARMTDASNTYQPISDWSAPFIIADDAATCGISRPILPTPTATATATNTATPIPPTATPIPPPIVTTNTTTSITTDSATLNVMVNANNISTSVRFELTLSSGDYTNAISVSATPATVTGRSATTVSATATGLLPGTTYYYRVVATNSSGTTNSSEFTFTTAQEVSMPWRVYLPLTKK